MNKHQHEVGTGTILLVLFSGVNDFVSKMYLKKKIRIAQRQVTEPHSGTEALQSESPTEFIYVFL